MPSHWTSEANGSIELHLLNSQENHKQIGWAIAEASDGLASTTGKPWGLSRDHHYQLSNRFAWSWKLASLGIPAVLLYLGFLNAQDMAEPLFRSEAEWTRAIRDHCRGAVDERCWGEWLDFAGVPPERRPLEVRPVPPRNSGGPESARGWRVTAAWRQGKSWGSSTAPMKACGHVALAGTKLVPPQ